MKKRKSICMVLTFAMIVSLFIGIDIEARNNKKISLKKVEALGKMQFGKYECASPEGVFKEGFTVSFYT